MLTPPTVPRSSSRSRMSSGLVSLAMKLTRNFDIISSDLPLLTVSGSGSRVDGFARRFLSLMHHLHVPLPFKSEATSVRRPFWPRTQVQSRSCIPSRFHDRALPASCRLNFRSWDTLQRLHFRNVDTSG